MSKAAKRLIVRLAKLSMPSFPATKLPLRVQIKHLKFCVSSRFHEDETISLGLLQPFFRILHRDVGYKLLRSILKRWPAMVKAQCKKAEDENLMLLARVEEQKKELEKAAEHKRVLLEQNKRLKEDSSTVKNRLKAYGEGFRLKKIPDERLEGIGMMIGVAMERWKREHVNREVDKKMTANTHFLCPITKEILEDPVVASDGHTYERHALGNWINLHGGKSPITRQPISILRDDDALKHYIDSTRARLESEIYDKCELPKP